MCPDLGVRGVWQPQVEALFDICVIDTDGRQGGTVCHILWEVYTEINKQVANINRVMAEVTKHTYVYYVHLRCCVS